ncbi:hypothetical protein K474DRAFT_1705554 [Panus rudis PR-1116 ss-1]|nr:hypothetical protein K474DRAFT_1705554 [Panus rudis PR-1116 ss-1]
MSLPATGHYLITSTKDHRLIGRKTHEELSVSPKGIFHLPSDTSRAFEGSGWIVEKESPEGNTYKLRSRYAPTGVERGSDHKVVAILLSEPELEHWILEPTDQAHVYILKTHDGRLGWTIENPDAEDSPIKLTDHPDKFEFKPSIDLPIFDTFHNQSR